MKCKRFVGIIVAMAAILALLAGLALAQIPAGTPACTAFTYQVLGPDTSDPCAKHKHCWMSDGKIIPGCGRAQGSRYAQSRIRCCLVLHYSQASLTKVAGSATMKTD
jgi:hypothetical protein